jgi:mycothiol synthase
MTVRAQSGQEIVLQDSPAMEGVRFRHFGGDSDIPGLVELWNAAYRVDDFDLVWTPETLAVQIGHPTNHDPAHDMIVAELDGRTVGVGTTQWSVRDGEYQAELDGAVLPELRGRGIGRAILHWTERRAREVADEHEADARWLTAWKLDSQRADLALLRSAGYEPVRYFFEMVRDLSQPIPDVPVPDGLQIRSVRDEDERQIFDAENEAFRDHWGHREFTDSDFERQLAGPQHDSSLWQVAWDGDQVAGAVTVGIYPDENAVLGLSRAWLERVSVRRPWRRRGVARTLMAAAMRGVLARGLAEAALGVDSENPTGALELYEGLGFVVAKRGAALRKPFDQGARQAP